jgi:hypothetical protein
MIEVADNFLSESNEIVTLLSPSGERFSIHAGPLAHQSRYFRTALNSCFREAADRSFSLTHHCNNEVLEIFTNWIYLKSCAVKYKIQDVAFMSEKNQDVAIKAWLFGDHIGAPLFQTDMMRFLLDWEESFFDCDLFQEFGPHVPEGCGLEKYLVDMFCFLMIRERKDEPSAMMKWLPPRLVEKVFQKLVQNALRVVSDGDWKIGKASRYKVMEQ